MKILILIVILLIPVITLANQNAEPESNHDLGLASIWAMGKLTQGGYIKTDAGLINYHSDINGTLAIHGGWRFTNHIKFGFALGGTLSAIKQIGASLITIGPTFGYSGLNKSIGRYSVDLSMGAAYADDTDSGVFFEPGFYLIHRVNGVSQRRLMWSSGISYRAYKNSAINSPIDQDLNSINLKLGLVFGTY